MTTKTGHWAPIVSIFVTIRRTLERSATARKIRSAVALLATILAPGMAVRAVALTAAFLIPTITVKAGIVGIFKYDTSFNSIGYREEGPGAATGVVVQPDGEDPSRW